MNTNGIITLVLVAVGVGLIILGAMLAAADFRKKHAAEIKADPHALDKTFSALAKILEALKGYGPGQQLIVFGIIVLIIAGVFGGISAI